MALRGENLRIKLSTGAGVEASYIGLAKTMEWNANANIVDTTTKDTDYGTKDYEPVDVERDFKTDHLIADSSTVEMWEKAVGQKIQYAFVKTTEKSSKNRGETSVSYIRMGTAILQSVNIVAQDREYATMSISCKVTDVSSTETANYIAQPGDTPAYSPEMGGTPIETNDTPLDE